MDPSHIVVSTLIAVTLGLLVWIEIRSRRNGRVNAGISPPNATDQQPDGK